MPPDQTQRSLLLLGLAFERTYDTSSQKGTEAPTLIQVKASMLVATAACPSMPKVIMTGTVIREVLPVTTLMTLVRKETAIRMRIRVVDTDSS